MTQLTNIPFLTSVLEKDEHSFEKKLIDLLAYTSNVYVVWTLVIVLAPFVNLYVNDNN